MNRKRKIAGLLVLAFSQFWACQKDGLSDAGPSGQNTQYSLNSAYTVASVLAGNAATHEAASDYTWDTSTEINILLSSGSISANAASVAVSGTIATISEGGNYRISGTLSDGQIRVACADDAAPVRLILDGAHITRSNSAAIYVVNASKTIVLLADGSQNSLADGSTYVYENESEEEPNATLFSGDALSITGNGQLTVDANFADAIASKDGLILSGGNITVDAKDDGIRGKDYLVVRSTVLDITAGGDGLKSDNDADATLGYIHVAGGSVDLKAGADAIQASTDVLIEKGNFSLTTASSTNSTAKGLKAGVHLVVDNGDFSLNTADDALHSNNNLCINAGTFSITSKDDGIHADSTLSINGGDITITQSYEGIESRAIGIRGGTIRLSASDDGLNVAGGNDGSASGNFPGAQSASNTGFFILVTGGYTVVNAAGDGVDANGAIEMTGGTLLVNGPTAQNNAALDYDASFSISGGLLVAVGSSGMAQAPDASSSQYSIIAGFGNTVQAGTLIHLETADGASLVTFKPAKNCQSFVFSAPELQQGNTYRLYTGGSDSGAVSDGLYSGGTYTAGNMVSEFTISGVVTRVQ